MSRKKRVPKRRLPKKPDPESERSLAAFGSVLHSLRVERRLTEQQLASRAGSSVELIRKMEAGEHDPLLHQIVALLTALSMRAEPFFQLVEKLLGDPP